MAHILQDYRFYADASRRSKKGVHPHALSSAEPYIAEPALVKAVNLAIYLERPLLLEGEAGCGKTRLASAVAYELGFPFYRWNIRSTSKAKDGLYAYDAMLRLHDVQTHKLELDIVERNPSDPKSYRSWGALGKAFQVNECPAVVLIDEIDKADLDFPNDLLTVLDDPWAFEIPETGEVGERKIKAKHMPIVIITSNKEKGDLPAPFLRRCIYHYVKFPDDEARLKKIVDAHYRSRSRKTKGIKKPSSGLFKAAAGRFLTLRGSGSLFKNPGTSEFLDWLNALQNFEENPYKAAQLKTDKFIPYPELIFKLRSDWLKHTA